MVKYINAEQAQNVIQSEETCILNIVAAWCPDCTEQAKNLAFFADDFVQQGVPVYELNVQEERRVFISPLHQQLTELFGGHGFPRTVLIKNGQGIDADNVEIISKEQLAELANTFKKQLNLS